MMNYKQKIGNIKYFDNVVKISLTRSEWNSSMTWIEYMEMIGCERLGKEWFEDLHWLVMFPISKDINFSNKNYTYNVDITFDIPRKLLKMFVYSIGRIAYDFDVKPITCIIAQHILEKINNQLKEELSIDDDWFIKGF